MKKNKVFFLILMWSFGAFGQVKIPQATRANTHQQKKDPPKKTSTSARDQVALELEKQGDEFYELREYTNAYYFYSKSLEYIHSERVVLKKNKSEERFPIELNFTFENEHEQLINFEDDQRNWRTENNVFKCKLNGVKGGNYWRHFEIPKLSQAKRVEISVDVNFVSGDPYYFYGFHFLSEKGNLSQRFGINANGDFWIGKYENGWIGEWKKSEYSRKGSLIWNNLKVVYEEGNCSYFINGIQVYQASIALYGNYVGLVQTTSVLEAWFDNFFVRGTF